jgi:hypothetical protein
VATPALQLAHGATQFTSVVEQPGPDGVRWSAALISYPFAAARERNSVTWRARPNVSPSSTDVRAYSAVAQQRHYSRQPRALTAKVPRPTCDEQAAAGTAFAARD